MRCELPAWAWQPGRTQSRRADNARFSYPVAGRSQRGTVSLGLPFQPRGQHALARRITNAPTRRKKHLKDSELLLVLPATSLGWVCGTNSICLALSQPVPVIVGWDTGEGHPP